MSDHPATNTSDDGGAEPSQLAIAERIAREAHAGQKDTVTGADYITHIERVVAAVEGDDAKAVAWLHDVLEDCPTWTGGALNKAGIPGYIVEAVIELTRVSQQPYDHYIRDLAISGNPLALAVKIADLRDHLRPNCPERLRPRYEAALKALTESTNRAVAGAAHEDLRTTENVGGDSAAVCSDLPLRDVVGGEVVLHIRPQPLRIGVKGDCTNCSAEDIADLWDASGNVGPFCGTCGDLLAASFQVDALTRDLAALQEDAQQLGPLKKALLGWQEDAKRLARDLVALHADRDRDTVLRLQREEIQRLEVELADVKLSVMRDGAYAQHQREAAEAALLLAQQERDAREANWERARVACYRQARVFEPSMDGYHAAMTTYAAAFGKPKGEVTVLLGDITAQGWELDATPEIERQKKRADAAEAEITRLAAQLQQLEQAIRSVNAGPDRFTELHTLFNWWADQLHAMSTPPAKLQAERGQLQQAIEEPKA